VSKVALKRELSRRRKEHALVTLDSIGDAVITTNSAGTITFLNQGAERLTGWEMSEALGQSMNDVFTVVHATTREAIADPMALAMQESRVGDLPGTCILIRRDEKEMYIEDSAAPIQEGNGKVTGAVIVFRDVSAQRKAAEQMMHASQHDFLTGLPNRLLLEDRLGQAIALAERHSGEVAVLYVDLDRFKRVNDSLGHLVGDKLLQSIAERMQGQVRTPDTVSRQGGDEFVVVLQEVRSRQGVEVVAQRILQAIAAVHAIGEHGVHVTASIGVALYPEDGLDAETLMKRADAALYEAKAGGRRCFRFFEGERKGGTLGRGEAVGREG
jgi:diguanylate cyclase (GGDEF)-like protein/PAS domain S-box-containing protein